MLDGSEYEHLKSLYHHTRNIVQDGTLFEKELACIELFESIGMLLNRYEAEAEAMAQWYEAQEAKMMKERMRIQLETSDDAYTSHQESMIAERCEYQGE